MNTHVRTYIKLDYSLNNYEWKNHLIAKIYCYHLSSSLNLNICEMAILKVTFPMKLKIVNFNSIEDSVVFLNSASLFDYAINFEHDLVVIHNTSGRKL